MNLFLQPEVTNNTCLHCQAIALESSLIGKNTILTYIFKAFGIHCSPTLEPLNPKPLNGHKHLKYKDQFSKVNFPINRDLCFAPTDGSGFGELGCSIPTSAHRYKQNRQLFGINQVKYGKTSKNEIGSPGCNDRRKYTTIPKRQTKTLTYPI